MNLTEFMVYVYKGYDGADRLYKKIIGKDLKRQDFEDFKTDRSISLVLPPVLPVNLEQLGEVYKLSTSILIAA